MLYTHYEVLPHVVLLAVLDKNFSRCQNEDSKGKINMSAKETKEGSITTSTTRNPVIHAPKLIKVAKADQPLYRRVIEAAKEAAERAYRPYSNYNVGAAVLSFDGKIMPAATWKTAATRKPSMPRKVPFRLPSPMGVLKRAEAAGLTQFQAFLAIAVYAPKGSDPWPCCNCRQSLSEFGFEMHVIGEGKDGEILCLTLGQLIPFPFPIQEVLESVRGER